MANSKPLKEITFPGLDGTYTIPTAPGDIGAVSKAGDTMSGPLAMGGKKITGLGTPTADTDAATKGYADKMLPKSGGTLTGWVKFDGTTIGHEWTTADGTVFQVRPYTSGNLFQIVTKTASGQTVASLDVKNDGTVQVGKTPVVDKDVATKAYADKFNISFGALSGSLSDINKTSTYWYSTSNTGRPSNGSSTYGLVETLITTNGGRVQILYGGNGEEARRIYAGNAWGEWEWINPPLSSGEYKTIERWNGKVVYAKYIATTVADTIGNTSGNYDFYIGHNIGSVPTIVRCEATVNGRYLLPYQDKDTGGSLSIIDVTGTNIVVRLYKTQWEKPTFNVVLYYTKG